MSGGSRLAINGKADSNLGWGISTSQYLQHSRMPFLRDRRCGPVPFYITLTPPPPNKKDFNWLNREFLMTHKIFGKIFFSIRLLKQNFILRLKFKYKI